MPRPHLMNASFIPNPAIETLAALLMGGAPEAEEE